MNNHKQQRIFERKAHAGVVQDKSVPLINRPASDQPYRHADEVRSNTRDAQSSPAQSRPKESLVPLTTQVRRSLKQEIQRVAKKEDMSDSATASAFLEKAIQGHIDLQYGAMLRPVIEQAISAQIKGATERTARFSMNAFLSAEQSRILIIHVLSLLLGGSASALPQLITQSRKQARINLRSSIEEEDEV